MLGPVLERLHDELLDPLVARVFNIMSRNGLFADIPMPRVLKAQHLQVEFISMLAQAQKAVATGAIERFWQFGGQIAALKPEAADRLDADGTMEAYADMTGIPSGVMVDYFAGGALIALRNCALITSPARDGGRAAMPRKIAVPRRQ
jgi:hypothetical protein